MDTIRKDVLEGRRIPRNRPAAARDVTMVTMSSPVVTERPAPPDSDHMNQALVVWSLRLFPADMVT